MITVCRVDHFCDELYRIGQKYSADIQPSQVMITAD